jgi:ketosteroid isomerase-like protein
MITMTGAQPPQPIPADVQLGLLGLIARMNQLLDDEDYEAYLACYAEDAVFDPGLAPPVTGKAAIRAFLHHAQASGFIVGKRHVPSTITLWQSGATVTARFYLTVFERAAIPAVVATAVITDTFEHRGDAWLATSHTTRVDPGFLLAQGQALGAADPPA